MASTDLPTTLAGALAAFGRAAFLVSVTQESRPHLAPVEVDPDVEAATASSPAPGGLAVAVLSGARSARNAAANTIVCLHWPPAPDTAGYSLIVDGEVTSEVREHDTVLHIRPVKAVLHRAGEPEPHTSACGHDCLGLNLPA